MSHQKGANNIVYVVRLGRFLQKGIKIGIEWGKKLIWSKGFLGLIGGKLHSRDLDYMRNMEDHCILTVGMVVTQERKEKEAKTYSHEVVQNGRRETELVWGCLSARKCGQAGHASHHHQPRNLVSDYAH